MESSFLYHASVSIISRQIILKSKDGSIGETSAMALMNYCMDGSQAVLLKSKKANERFPDLIGKKGQQITLNRASFEYWASEDEAGFARGDICFYMNRLPLFDGFLREYESRILWNYSAIVNPSLEKWSRENIESESKISLVQHSNRVLGADYVIIKLPISGMIELLCFLKNGMHFGEWGENIPQVESAIADSKENWAKKWFLADDVFAKSLDAINSLIADG